MKDGGATIVEIGQTGTILIEPVYINNGLFDLTNHRLDLINGTTNQITSTKTNTGYFLSLPEKVILTGTTTQGQLLINQTSPTLLSNMVFKNGDSNEWEIGERSYSEGNMFYLYNINNGSLGGGTPTYATKWHKTGKIEVFNNVYPAGETGKTYTLGESTKKWDNIFTKEIEADSIALNGNYLINTCAGRLSRSAKVYSGRNSVVFVEWTDYDSNSVFGNCSISGGSRIQVNSTGVYMLGYTIMGFSGAGSRSLRAYILDNGSGYITGSEGIMTIYGNYDCITVSIPYYLPAGNTIALMWTMDSTNAWDVKFINLWCYGS